jgi:DNA polymerase-3 subunit delta'
MALPRFSEIRGHRSQLEVLRRLAQTGRHAHAWLFQGPAGVGKDTVAQAFVTRLACLGEPGPEPCGVCRSCAAAERGDHPDVMRVVRDGAQIRIDQVRTIGERIRFEPVLGRCKAVLIEDADTLNEMAANALLKTLEEPASATVFVLLTAKPQVLLDTIRSRCQALRFAELAQADVAALLEAEGHDRDVAVQASVLAQGSMHEARTLADPKRLALVDFVVQFALRLGADPSAQAAAFCDRLAERFRDLQRSDDAEDDAADDDEAKGKLAISRADLHWTLDVLRALFRDAALVASGLDPAELPHARHGAALRAMAERTTPGQLAGVVDACAAAEDREALNPNPRFALLTLLVDTAATLRV